MKSTYRIPIIIGLLIFLGLIAAPFVLNATSTYQAPEPTLPTLAQVQAAGYSELACVESRETMRTTHMQLLNEWRDWALRDGHRTYVNSHGVEYTISLQNTCMKCHVKKADFCDKCHTDAGVSPYCWDCHILPEGLQQ